MNQNGSHNSRRNNFEMNTNKLPFGLKCNPINPKVFPKMKKNKEPSSLPQSTKTLGKALRQYKAIGCKIKPANLIKISCFYDFIFSETKN